MSKLTPKQARFVAEYLVDLNGTQAAIRAGYSSNSAGRFAQELLLKTHITAAIQAAQAERARRTEITQDAVLQRYWAIATANPNDLIQHRRVNCRYCWGQDHYYQWTAGEYHAALASAKERKKPKPDCDGGFGFDRTRAPHPDCPECRGEGRSDIVLADTSKATGGAAMLYAGIKQTKDGIQVLMHDQLHALDKVAAHVGLVGERRLLGNDPDNPLTPTRELVEAEVDKRIAELQGKIVR